MNIRDRKIFYALMTLIGLMGILTSCHREEIPNDNPQQSETPISFTPTSDWPTLTKSLYNDVSHLAGDGIVVWAELESAPAFGVNGTKADYPDWSYSPTRYWTPSESGYDFAAVLPASVFDTSHPETSETGITGSFSNGKLELDFGEDGLDFNKVNEKSKEKKKPDLMVAFAHQNYTSSDLTNGVTPEPVDLSFDHQLVQLKFEVKNLITVGNPDITPSINLTKFSVSGFHSIVKSAVFTESSAEWTPKNETEGDTCEYTYTEAPVTIANGSSELIISSILAIPETSCNLTVSVEHTEVLGDNSIESTPKSATISDCTWEAGKTYVYPLKITKSGIIFLDPTVTDWLPGGEVGNIEFK